MLEVRALVHLALKKKATNVRISTDFFESLILRAMKKIFDRAELSGNCVCVFFFDTPSRCLYKKGSKLS